MANKTRSLQAALPLGITMGDAAGIGPEIIIKLFAQGLPAASVVYGDANVLKETARWLGLTNIEIRAYQTLEQALAEAKHKQPSLNEEYVISVINRHKPLPQLELGKVNAAAGQGAYNYLCQAIEDAQNHKLRAIVTAPLNKEALLAAKLNYPGHTEILAEKTHSPEVAMMLATPELKVILATIHIPLMQVAQHLSESQQLKTIRLAHQACQQTGIEAPRIAVAGLNPHAGEGGRFGDEEQTIISPAISQAQSEGLNVTGPWPGDTIFMRARKGEFDIVVAQYHDQGLIPIKLLGLEEGVNVTVGLPFIRTSVDHGTAFDIAGQGIADSASLLAAAELAIQLS